MKWQEATNADGPQLVEWIYRERLAELEGGIGSAFGESFSRRLFDWKRGTRPDFWTVDRYLTMLGLHPSEVPENIWCRDSRVVVPEPRSCRYCGEEIEGFERMNSSHYARLIYCDAHRYGKGISRPFGTPQPPKGGSR